MNLFHNHFSHLCLRYIRYVHKINQISRMHNNHQLIIFFAVSIGDSVAHFAQGLVTISIDHRSCLSIFCPLVGKEFYFLLNFFPKNSINSTIPIPTIKQIMAHKSWFSHWYWFGKIFFAVHKFASKVSFQGQILFKEPSINPVNEARVIIL